MDEEECICEYPILRENPERLCCICNLYMSENRYILLNKTKMDEENNNTEKQRDVIYLVVNDDMIAIASAHWKLEDAKKKVEDWHKNQPQSQIMVVEIEIN